MHVQCAPNGEGRVERTKPSRTHSPMGCLASTAAVHPTAPPPPATLPLPKTNIFLPAPLTREAVLPPCDELSLPPRVPTAADWVVILDMDHVCLVSSRSHHSLGMTPPVLASQIGDSALPQVHLFPLSFLAGSAWHSVRPGLCEWVEAVVRARLPSAFSSPTNPAAPPQSLGAVWFIVTSLNSSPLAPAFFSLFTV